MLFVITHAQPAELVLASATRHVHTPRVLLNRSLALGARLCVKLNPLCRVVFCVTEPFEPLLQ
jgi:hypothetical protein